MLGWFQSSPKPQLYHRDLGGCSAVGLQDRTPFRADLGDL